MTPGSRGHASLARLGDAVPGIRIEPTFILSAGTILLLAGLSLAYTNWMLPGTVVVGRSAVAQIHASSTSSTSTATTSMSKQLQVVQARSAIDASQTPSPSRIASSKSAVRSASSSEVAAMSVASAHAAAEGVVKRPRPSQFKIPSYRLTLVHGLTNRLYALLSFIDGAHSEGRGVDAHWVADEQCPGTFDSVFVPSALPPDVKVLSTPSLRNSLRTGWLYPNNPRPDLGRLALEFLRLRPPVQARVDELLATLGWPASPFSALHMRHTDMDTTFHDHIGSSDAQALAWAATTSGPLFVAADNAASLSLLQAAFPNRVVSGSTFNPPPERVDGVPGNATVPTRHTTLADAVVDMWVASYSTDFMGTAGSTFSEQIDAMRQARGALNGARFCYVLRNATWCTGEPRAGVRTRPSTPRITPPPARSISEDPQGESVAGTL